MLAKVTARCGSLVPVLGSKNIHFVAFAGLCPSQSLPKPLPRQFLTVTSWNGRSNVWLRPSKGRVGRIDARQRRAEAEECVLAIDIGTGGTKAALITRIGQVLSTGFSEHSLVKRTIRDGSKAVEQDPCEWWRATVKAVTMCLGDNMAALVEAVAVTGQMQDVILVPNGGGAIPPAILYSDTRAAKQAAEIAALAGGDDIVTSVTGTPQGASSVLAKLRWLDQHEPEASSNCKVVLLGGHDYVVHQLCGCQVTDVTTASTTGLTSYDSPDAYAESLVGSAGLEHWLDKVPHIHPVAEPCGQVSEAAATALGLSALKGLPIFHTCGDAGATTIGCGAGSPGSQYIYLGTSGWIAGTVDRQNLHPPGNPEHPKLNPPGVFSLAHPSEGLLFRTGSVMTAGGNLQWAAKVFLDGTGWEEVNKGVAASPAGAGGVLYLPYLNGERCPFDDGNARAAFLGLSGSATDGDLLRAVMEGVAFALRDARDAMLTSHQGSEARTPLRLVGGGAKSSVWPLIISGAFAQPVQVLSDAQEVAVKGAAVLAGLWLGWHNSLTPEGDWVEVEQTFTASDEDINAYQLLYPVYQEASRALRKVDAELAKVRAQRLS